VSEILARGAPLLVVDPIPGQEEWNADYVVGVGAGVQLRRPEMVADAVRRLLDDEGRLTAMRDRARLAGRPRAALDIAADIVRDLERASDFVRRQSGALPARRFTAGLLEEARCDRVC
jgi:processive 1,2-diacylglycerol beta-glucosyltransferase